MSLNKVSVCLSFLLIGAMLQQVSCQSATTATCSLATTNSHSVVLNWLKGKGVTILPDPKKDVDAKLCGGLWSQSGTCCDVDSLKKYIKTVNDGLASKWGKYVSRIARIKGKLIGSFQKIFKAFNKNSLEKKVSQMKANNKVKDTFGKVFAMIPATEDQLNALKESVEKFDDQLKVYKEKGKECFNAMKIARSNLMCGACSAVGSTLSATPTTTLAQFKITNDDCSGLVAKCYPVWKFNFDLATMVQFFSLLRAPGKSGDKVTPKYTSEYDMSTTDLETVKEDFALCTLKTGETALTCTKTTTAVKDITARLCTKLFTANKENAYIEGDETVDADIEDKDVQEADATATEVAKEAGTTSRLLQSAQTTEITVGVTTADSSTVPSINTADSALVPDSTVTTSTAGDESGSSGNKSALKLMASAATLALMIASALF